MKVNKYTIHCVYSLLASVEALFPSWPPWRPWSHGPAMINSSWGPLRFIFQGCNVAIPWVINTQISHAKVQHGLVPTFRGHKNVWCYQKLHFLRHIREKCGGRFTQLGVLPTSRYAICYRTVRCVKLNRLFHRPLAHLYCSFSVNVKIVNFTWYHDFLTHSDIVRKVLNRNTYGRAELVRHGFGKTIKPSRNLTKA